MIESGGLGAGGHYNSLSIICNELSKYNNTRIVLLGNGQSKIIESNKHFLCKIDKRIDLKRKIIELNPDIVHCFDTNSLLYLLSTRIFRNLPKIVLSKCGGPNPNNKYYWFADAIINFSLENHYWFKKNSRYHNSAIHLIPNRIERPDDVLIKTNSTELKILRVSRIGAYYKKTLFSTIELAEVLSEKYSIKLQIVGVVQDISTFKELEERLQSVGFSFELITDNRAFFGSSYIPDSDIVVGTGRSFMEAMSFGKIVLSPAMNSRFPVLVSDDNFLELFEKNFSERGLTKNFEPERTLKLLNEIIQDPEERDKYAIKSIDYFNKYFDVAQINKLYSKVYRDALIRDPSKRVLIYTRNLLQLIKSIVSKRG